MDFLRHEVGSDVRLTAKFELDISCTVGDGFMQMPNADGCKGPGGWNSQPKALRPQGRLPSELILPTASAIYRFEIDHPDRGNPMIYVGKATSLRTRIGQYAGMVRRLLALYAGHAVWVDKDPLRFVHFRIAEALIDGRSVTLHYYTKKASTSKQQLAREELLEICHAAMHYHNEKIFEERILNSLSAFAGDAHTTLKPNWARVQDLIRRQPDA